MIFQYLIALSSLMLWCGTDGKQTNLFAELDKEPIMDGTMDFSLNVTYPVNEGNIVNYKVFNISRKALSPVEIMKQNLTGTSETATKSVLVKYPMEGETGQNFDLLMDVRMENKLFFIHEINVSYTLTDAVFPNLNDTFRGNSVTLNSNLRPKFQTPEGHVFECKKTVPIDMEVGSKLFLTNTTFRAFDNSSWSDAAKEICPIDYDSRADIRIATGSAFAAIIVAAIIAAVLLNYVKCGSD